MLADSREQVGKFHLILNLERFKKNLRWPTFIGSLSVHNITFYAPLKKFSRERWIGHAC